MCHRRYDGTFCERCVNGMYILVCTTLEFTCVVNSPGYAGPYCDQPRNNFYLNKKYRLAPCLDEISSTKSCYEQGTRKCNGTKCECKRCFSVRTNATCAYFIFTWYVYKGSKMSTH